MKADALSRVVWRVSLPIILAQASESLLHLIDTIFLARVGVIDHRFLIRHSRYAVIALALLAAVLTPPDLISQVLLMAPLILLYGISIAAAYIARWRMNRLERGAE